MESTLEAPAPSTTEAPEAPQSTEVVAQPSIPVEAPKPAAEGVQIDRGQRLAEINKMVADKPDEKLSDADLEIFMEGQDGKLKPKETEAVEKSKVETKEKAVAPAEDAVAKALKEVGAKTVEELPAKIQELRKALSGKDAQAVAQVTKERDTARTDLQAANKLISDLQAGKPEALKFLTEKLGIKLPDGKPQPAQPFTKEDDDLVGGALSRAFEQTQALRSRLEQIEAKAQEGEQTRQQEQVQSKAKSQVVDEALAVAHLIPELKALPNLRNRIIDFQAGKDDPELSTLSEVFDYVVNAHAEKGLMLDPETAFYVMRGKNMDAALAAAEEKGRKEAYNHKPNKSMSNVSTEEQSQQTYTDEQVKSWDHDASKIPNEFFDKDMNLDKKKIPQKYWPKFGLG